MLLNKLKKEIQSQEAENLNINQLDNVCGGGNCHSKIARTVQHTTAHNSAQHISAVYNVPNGNRAEWHGKNPSKDPKEILRGHYERHNG